KRSSQGSPTRTRRMYGRWVSEDRELRWPELTPASGGHTTRSSLTIAVGMGRTPTTTTTGMTPSTTASVTLEETIRLSHAMIMVTGPIPLALWWATMALEPRLEWRLARNGSAAAIWTRATAHRRD